MRILAASLLKLLLARKLEALSLVVIAAIITMAVNIENYLKQFVPSPPDIWAVRIFLMAVVAILIAFFVYFYFRPKFKHLPDLGVNQDIKTGAYFCSPVF